MTAAAAPDSALVELSVVVLIIGILAALSVPALKRSPDQRALERGDE